MPQPMTEERAKEIALLFIKAWFKKEGIRGNTMRDLGNLAKDVGLETDELRSLVLFFLPEMLEDIFNLSSVSINIKE